MASSSRESWRLMPVRLLSVVCSSCSVAAWSCWTPCDGLGEIGPGVGVDSAPSGFTTVLGGMLRAASLGLPLFATGAGFLPEQSLFPFFAFAFLLSLAAL